MDARILPALATTALLLVVAAPTASADHPDTECWSLGAATKCYVQDAQDGFTCPTGTPDRLVLCIANNQADAAGTYARRACDALTGQACTQP